MLKTLPRDVPEMDTLDYVTLMTIKDMAVGMEKDEILATFSIDWADLSKTEQIYFEEFSAYGKGMAINTVVQNLLDGTKGKAGTQAAMQFLKRFAKQFEKEVEGDSSGNFSFRFGPE